MWWRKQSRECSMADKPASVTGQPERNHLAYGRAHYLIYRQNTERWVISGEGKIRPNPSFFSLVLCSQCVTPPCADLYPATPVLGDFWLWYKLDQHKFAFKLIGFTDETAACKKQKCPVRQFWVASRLMQGREEGHVGSFGKLLWRAAAPPVPGWEVVRKDIIKKWEHVFFFPSPSPGGFP